MYSFSIFPLRNRVSLPLAATSIFPDLDTNFFRQQRWWEEEKIVRPHSLLFVLLVFLRGQGAQLKVCPFRRHSRPND